MKTLGRHLVAEFYDCDAVRLDDVRVIERSMRAAADAVGATIVGDLYHRYEPQGVTGTVLIAESHMSVHTWPESGYAAIDIFTCGGLDPRPGFEVLMKGLGARSCRVQELVRGLADDVDVAHPITPDDVLIVSRVAPLIMARE
ncbi:MAG: adenosylmethionine decarboxylase [Deltaproteobacteria bacterium]|nr:adenosylmethionine decarboxylase [Deltaproteobacteria bacterium]